MFQEQKKSSLEKYIGITGIDKKIYLVIINKKYKV